MNSVRVGPNCYGTIVFVTFFSAYQSATCNVFSINVCYPHRKKLRGEWRAFKVFGVPYETVPYPFEETDKRQEVFVQIH